jgi:hypothetical protein
MCLQREILSLGVLKNNHQLHFIHRSQLNSSIYFNHNFRKDESILV